MLNPSAPSGKETKYARHERERRFLLAGAPEAAIRVVEITDRYITGTRLRLRSVREAGTGIEVAYKLTQKVPAPNGGPGLITTTYLAREEHDVLSLLPATVLHKTRRSLPPLGIDIFEGPLVGLILAEAEFDTDEAMAAFEVPAFAVAEVTDDPRFTGGRLVVTSRTDMQNALKGFGMP